MNLFQRPPRPFQYAIFSVAAGLFTYWTTAIVTSTSRAADDKKSPPAKAALTVSTVQPMMLKLPLRLPANGSITAWQEAIIGSEASGLRLVSVNANVGDKVAKGQVLATFATEQVGAEVAQAQASLLEAQANAQDAAINADKARTLQASGALSEQQINQYTTLDKSAKARLEVAQAALAVQQVRLKQTAVLAPDSGIISSRPSPLAAVVGNGVWLLKMFPVGGCGGGGGRAAAREGGG